MLLVFVSCRGRHEQLVSEPDMTVDVMLPTTPIKDQGRTSLCWIYTMLATIETDCLAKGDSVNLSPMWLARKSMEEQVMQAYLVGSNINMRGTLMEAMRLYNRYGIVGFDAAPPRKSMQVSRELTRMAKTMAAQQRGLEALNDAAEDVLDREVGPMPRYVFMLGMEYTPLEFAHSCALPGEWQAYTSFTHHPYGEPFCIELKDNRQRHEVMNVPLDTLYNMVVSSLKHRHPVAWEGTLRGVESGKRGVESGKLKVESSGELRVKSGELRVKSGDIVKKRQRAFEKFRLTDDHCMAIVGFGHRKDGTPVFICKNSWGKNDGNRGMRYMTKDEFLMSTMLVMLKQ